VLASGLPFGSSSLTFPGKTCLKHWVSTNFYFHLTMTYALLRRAGVDLGKRDYLGGLNLQ
jgi:hypothetical protein